MSQCIRCHSEAHPFKGRGGNRRRKHCTSCKIEMKISYCNICDQRLQRGVNWSTARNSAKVCNPCRDKLVERRATCKICGNPKEKFGKICHSCRGTIGGYFHLAEWHSNILSYSVPGIEKVKEIGFFSIKNPEGVVRDHMYGRRAGLKNGVFPELLKHPANCQIITHRENTVKGNSEDDCSITLEELFTRIRNFQAAYAEQEICLVKIAEYNAGERYSALAAEHQ